MDTQDTIIEMLRDKISNLEHKRYRKQQDIRYEKGKSEWEVEKIMDLSLEVREIEQELERTLDQLIFQQKIKSRYSDCPSVL